MKRFYDTVEVGTAESGFTVLLDGRPVHTPAKAVLVLPTEALAAGLAEEWASQGDTVVPAGMHLTQLAATAIDRLSALRDTVVATIAAYAETDLLCHRAAHPVALTERQQAVWQPLLDWAAMAFDAPLRATVGVIPASQSPAALAALRRVVAAQDDWRLTALHNLTVLMGSVVLGLAVIRGRIEAEAAFEASQIDEAFQNERWGEDAEAAVRHNAIRREVVATGRFARLLEVRPAGTGAPE